MGDRFGFRLLLGIALVGALAVVGVYTYNLGLAHGQCRQRPRVSGGRSDSISRW